MNPWLACLICSAMSILVISAQTLQPKEEKPPIFNIVDGGNFLNRESGAYKRVSDAFRKIEAEYGFKIYLVVEPLLITSTAAERANELFKRWLPDGDGMVIFFEADSRRIGVGRDLDRNPAESTGKTFVPVYEMSAILGRSMTALTPEMSPEMFLETLSLAIAHEFDVYFKGLATPPSPQRSMRLSFLVIGTLSLLGLAAIALGALLRRTSVDASQTLRFPAVDLPERLGAPCGSQVTTRRFRNQR